MKSLGLLLLLLLATTVSAQVTIGKSEEPVSGALLQLKTEGTYSGLTNSNKGMTLPRVELTNRFKLIPMLNSVDAADPAQIIAHTGLIVYNVNDLYFPYCKGVYVWSGEEWVPLPEAELAPQPTITDGEGNTYTYAKIGDKYWLTQNVRTVTVNGEGTTLINNPSDATLIRDIAINTGYQNNGLGVGKGILVGQSISDPIPDPERTIEYYERQMGFPNPIKQVLNLNEYANKFGFLYSWEYSQKACPTGWRLPTDADWEALGTALGGMAVAGKKLKSDYVEYKSADNQTAVWDAYSLCDPLNSRFNALPGGATDATQGTNILHFGLNTRWYSQTSQRAYGLDIGSDALKVWSSLNKFRYPVRCVRDTAP